MRRGAGRGCVETGLLVSAFVGVNLKALLISESYRLDEKLRLLIGNSRIFPFRLD